MIDVTYNGHALNDGVISVVNVADHKSSIPQLNNSYKLARVSGVKLVSRSFTQKTIALTGYISASTRAGFDTACDTLKSYFLTDSEAVLDIEYGSSTRRYYCSLESSVEIEPYGVDYSTWRAVLVCNRGYGQGTTLVTTSELDISTNSYDGHATISGTFYAKPTITLTLDVGTGITPTEYMQVKNLDTGEYVKVERNWVAGDVLVVNTVDQTVKVNGTEVDFYGNLPDEWTPGLVNYEYTDSFTTRQVDIVIEHIPLYL